MDEPLVQFFSETGTREEIARVDRDGTVHVAREGSEPEAARLFWRAIEVEGRGLHARIAELEAQLAADRAHHEVALRAEKNRGEAELARCGERGRDLMEQLAEARAENERMREKYSAMKQEHDAAVDRNFAFCDRAIAAEKCLADVQIKLDCRVRDLDIAVSDLAAAQSENERITDEWERMYTGRECPRCGNHVTMNIEGDLPEIFQRRLAAFHAHDEGRVERVRSAIIGGLQAAGVEFQGPCVELAHAVLAAVDGEA